MVEIILWPLPWWAWCWVWWLSPKLLSPSQGPYSRLFGVEDGWGDQPLNFLLPIVLSFSYTRSRYHGISIGVFGSHKESLLCLCRVCERGLMVILFSFLMLSGLMCPSAVTKSCCSLLRMENFIYNFTVSNSPLLSCWQMLKLSWRSGHGGSSLWFCCFIGASGSQHESGPH